MTTPRTPQQDFRREAAGLPPQEITRQAPSTDSDRDPQDRDVQGADPRRLESGSRRLAADETRQQQLGADEDGDIEPPDTGGQRGR